MRMQLLQSEIRFIWADRRVAGTASQPNRWHSKCASMNIYNDQIRMIDRYVIRVFSARLKLRLRIAEAYCLGKSSIWLQKYNQFSVENVPIQVYGWMNDQINHLNLTDCSHSLILRYTKTLVFANKNLTIGIFKKRSLSQFGIIFFTRYQRLPFDLYVLYVYFMCVYLYTRHVTALLFRAGAQFIYVYSSMAERVHCGRNVLTFLKF